MTTNEISSYENEMIMLRTTLNKAVEDINNLCHVVHNVNDSIPPCNTCYWCTYCKKIHV